jgi:hypothetical protein
MNTMASLDPDKHDEEADTERKLRTLLKELMQLRAELPQMRKENQRLMAFLQDAAAYLRYHDQKPTRCTQAIMLQTLSHDIRGLASDEPCFVPQVSGYAKAEEEAQRRHDNAVRRP